jgi:hypothetical protein
MYFFEALSRIYFNVTGYSMDKMGKRKREKHFLLLTQEMGAKTPRLFLE